jgi:hypothetical protein
VFTMPFSVFTMRRFRCSRWTDPGVHDGPEHAVVAALLAFGLLEQWKVPPWVVVAASAAAGQWLLGA